MLDHRYSRSSSMVQTPMVHLFPPLLYQTNPLVGEIQEKNILDEYKICMEVMHMFHARFEYYPYQNEDSIRRLLDSDDHSVHFLPVVDTTKFKRQICLQLSCLLSFLGQSCAKPSTLHHNFARLPALWPKAPLETMATPLRSLLLPRLHGHNHRCWLPEH
ncbi:hypothetical protein AALO_G00182730 [Alosa alosa]|uniref:Maturase K n=1 Tax=Alosa alosa TaxID=278164 RepID=A0AAV6GAV6_9TELE|nr:hypothetical protein AALO_G00182730 [Alosa alosa]